MRQILARPGAVWLTALIAHHLRGTYYPVGHQRRLYVDPHILTILIAFGNRDVQWKRMDKYPMT